METGFLIINKPTGITSFDVIRQLRKITGVKKIGHCGTLDPLASGVLICAVGRGATKKISLFLKSDKEYIARIKLGEKSNTFDSEGKIEKVEFSRMPVCSDIENVLKKFIGEIEQMPPIFSAKKIKGRRACDLVRAGEKVRLNPAIVKIYNIKVISFRWPYLTIKLNCGSGTYVRSLANDMGDTLGVGGILVGLERTKIKNIGIKKTIALERLSFKTWQDYLFNIEELIPDKV